MSLVGLTLLIQYSQAKPCVDFLPTCKENAKYCYAVWLRKHYELQMKKHCRKTCGLCTCGQKKDFCVRYAANGQCAKNKPLMLTNCEKSCGLCGCTDDDRDCPKMAKANQCKTGPEFMHVLCRKSCNVCGCKDLYSACKGWSKEGWCLKNPDFMHIYCRKSCQVCRVTTKPKPKLITDRESKAGKINSEFCSRQSRKRVVGGKEANAGQWPWLVAMSSIQKPKKIYCVGSIITNKWVLTSALCALKVKPKDLILRLGEHDPNKIEGHEVMAKVKRSVYRGRPNNIALLELKKKIKFNRWISPICLADRKYDFFPGKTCVISGWGALKELGNTTNVLHSATVPLVNRRDCDAGHISLSRLSICAGYSKGGSDTCTGDNGGPLACPKNSGAGYEQVGIMSVGFGCGRPGRYSIYTYIPLQRTWIDSVLQGKTKNFISIT